MGQYIKSHNIKALYILIVQSLHRKLDIGANISDIQFSKINFINNCWLRWSTDIVPSFYFGTSSIKKYPPVLFMDFLGEVKHWSGLNNVHIGTIWTIWILIGGICLFLSPLSYGEKGFTFNSLIAEWAWIIMNGLMSYLLGYGGLQTTVPLAGSFVDVENGNRACT